MNETEESWLTIQVPPKLSGCGNATPLIIAAMSVTPIKKLGNLIWHVSQKVWSDLCGLHVSKVSCDKNEGCNRSEKNIRGCWGTLERMEAPEAKHGACIFHEP